MMSLSRIFGLMLLFFFFEAVVAVVATFAYPEVNVFLACSAMTALALAVWAVFALVTRVMTRPRVPQLAPTPKAVTPVPARPVFGDDTFSQELGSLIAEANRRLAGSMPANARGEAPSVATLPLYIVVGAEGAGKTSAILDSGLEPQLLAGEASREGTTIPTRLCNFWFAQGAVFADISGRILTQESENWERALRVFSQPTSIPRWRRILFGRRSDTNLKGFLLVCDAAPFVKASDAQRTTAFARTLSDRLQRAASILRREFPVYVLFSKCDGVQYFSEFFSHLSEPETRRLLGATLPLLNLRHDTADIYADREGKRLTEYFNRLCMSLAEKRLIFLAREEETKKKSTAYEFPRELKKIRGDVVQFLLDVFRPNPLQPGPRLRGFYFSGQRWVARNLSTSGEGTMMGFTVIPKRADATVLFGSKPAATPARPAMSSGAIAKWMFLTDVFNKIILKDRAGYVAPRVNTRDQEYRNFALAGAGALLLVACLLWANSWRHNRDLLNRVQSAVEGVHIYRSDAASYEESLADLDSIRSPLTTLLQYERNGAPLSYRWGLYSGNDLVDSVSGLYFDRFRSVFITPLLASLTSRFLQLDSSAPVADDIYTALKAYRMITSGQCRPNGEFLGNSLIPIWADSVQLAPSGAGALANQQIQFYISELLIRNPYERSISEDSAAVAHAQQYLREFNGPDKILRALVEQINHEHVGDALSNYVMNYGDVLTGPSTVDAAYTRDGWNSMMANIRQHKLATVGEPCVLGKQPGSTDFSFSRQNEQDVQELYVKNYIQRWESFVGAHHVEPFRNAADAAQKLKVLADNNRSPLLGLVYMAAHNTDLSQTTGESTTQVIKEAAKQKLNQKLAGILGKSVATKVSNEEAALSTSVSAGPGDVVHAFDALRVVTDPVNREKWLNSNNQPYMQALDELGNAIMTMPARIDPKDQANQQAVDRANKALEAAIAAHHALGAIIPNTASGVDVDVKGLLLEPITYAGRIIKGTPLVPPPPPPPDLTIPIRAGVNASAKNLCSSVDGLRTKYPFNAGTSQETSLQELAAVFAPPNGALVQFGQSSDVSKAYLRQGHVWAQNPSFPGTFSQSFLGSLNDLSSFGDAIYADGTPSAHFDYTVTLGGTGHAVVELDVDGHVLVYNPKKGPATARLVWPPVTNAPTRLTIKAGQTLTNQYSGLWSLFRLLDTADKQEGGLFVFSTIQISNGGNRNTLQDNKGNPVTVQIRIDSPAAVAFTKGYFGKLRCENFAGWALR
jgi:type VI secretion system protein ImpL